MPPFNREPTFKRQLYSSDILFNKTFADKPDQLLTSLLAAKIRYKPVCKTFYVLHTTPNECHIVRK